VESGAKIGIGTALVLVGFSVLGVVVRVANRHTHDKIAKKQAAPDLLVVPVPAPKGAK